MKIFIAASLLITPSLFANFALAEEESKNVSKHLSTIVVPEPILRVEPKYPMSAARDGREGWAVFSFVINEEGRVEDVLVKETSGSKDITKAAQRAIGKWRYKPAMVNGKPIQQCVNTVQMDFKMGGNNTTKGVSRRFKNKYSKALAALNSQDFSELDELILQMKKTKSMHLSEYNYLQLLMADYAKAQGKKAKQLKHLSRVAMALTPLADDKQKLSVLYQVFNLQIELNQFQAAYTSYEKLIKLPAAKPYLDKFTAVIAKLDAVIAGDQDIVINGVVKKDFWTADLVRNNFSLVDVEGSLHTLDVRCANKRHVYTIEEDSTWKVPASWENCSIYVYGEPKTQFKLIEHSLDT
ncbi:MAG: energy transducer TonB [Colwellia sp.]|nr:energy transducer TonB [Colwellia sp.]